MTREHPISLWDATAAEDDLGTPFEPGGAVETTTIDGEASFLVFEGTREPEAELLFLGTNSLTLRLPSSLPAGRYRAQLIFPYLGDMVLSNPVTRPGAVSSVEFLGDRYRFREELSSLTHPTHDPAAILSGWEAPAES